MGQNGKRLWPLFFWLQLLAAVVHGAQRHVVPGSPACCRSWRLAALTARLLRQQRARGAAKQAGLAVEVCGKGAGDAGRPIASPAGQRGGSTLESCDSPVPAAWRSGAYPCKVCTCHAHPIALALADLHLPPTPCEIELPPCPNIFGVAPPPTYWRHYSAFPAAYQAGLLVRAVPPSHCTCISRACTQKPRGAPSACKQMSAMSHMAHGQSPLVEPADSHHCAK
jgi:hypothetical protein